MKTSHIYCLNCITWIESSLISALIIIKLLNILSGIQCSSCKQPCPYYESSNLQDLNTISADRTLGSIRCSAAAYKSAGSFKKNARLYTSCIHPGHYSPEKTVNASWIYVHLPNCISCRVSLNIYTIKCLRTGKGYHYG